MLGMILFINKRVEIPFRQVFTQLPDGLPAPLPLFACFKTSLSSSKFPSMPFALRLPTSKLPLYPVKFHTPGNSTPREIPHPGEFHTS
jgi:hypothetical protein